MTAPRSVQRRVVHRKPPNEEPLMATYIALLNWTEQGIKAFKDTASRAEKFGQAAQKAGVTLRQIYWTLGHCDMVAILEGPDDASVAGVLMSLSAQGNVRSQTMRAFTRSEIGAVVSKAL
jgi:uncharacterized protein with GYD domain